MQHDPRLIKIGRFTHHHDRINFNAWKSSRAQDAFAALQREGRDYDELATSLRAGGRLTDAGIAEKLRQHIVDRKLHQVLAQAEADARIVGGAVLAARMALRPKVDKADVVAAMRRERMLDVLLAAEIGERVQLALDPDYADAILAYPRRVSGLPEDVYIRVETAAIERAHPGKLAEAEAETFSALVVKQAVEGFRAQLREDAPPTGPIFDQQAAAQARLEGRV